MNEKELASVKEYFNALSAVEIALSGFYALCFEYWPEEKLWGSLVPEEQRHSETVLGMLAAVEASPESFTLLRPLNLRALSLFVEGVKASSAKVRSGAYRKLHAMAVSADMEKTVTEARYDTLLATENMEYCTGVETLRRDTARHSMAFAQRIATLDVVK